MAFLCQLKKQTEINNLINYVFTDSQFFQHPNQYPIKVSLLKTIYDQNQKSHILILPFAIELFNKYDRVKEFSLFSITLTKIINKLYKGKNDKDNAKVWAIKFAEKCCESDASFHDLDKEIEEAIIEIARINDYDWANKLRIKKKALNELLFKNMNMQSISFTLPESAANEMKERRDGIINVLEKLDGLSQFLFFNAQFNPLAKLEIEKQLKENDEHSILDIVNALRFNGKNELIYQSATASQKQKLENKTYDIYVMHGITVFDLLINPFVHYVKFDDELILFLKKLVDHNELISQNQNVVYNYIINGISEKKIRSALAGLLPQLEEGLRNYFERKNMIPVMRSGGKEIKMSLGQMFNNEVFRKFIEELIGEDLTQHIKYLACKELGGDLRNKYFHEGHSDDSQCTVDEVVLFFLIIRLIAWAMMIL